MAPTATTPARRTEDEPFDDVVTEQGHQHDRVDHNVEGVYGGGGYHRMTHGGDAERVALPGMREAQEQGPLVHVQNDDVAGPGAPEADAAHVQNEDMDGREREPV